MEPFREICLPSVLQFSDPIAFEVLQAHTSIRTVYTQVKLLVFLSVWSIDEYILIVALFRFRLRGNQERKDTFVKRFDVGSD